MIYIIANLPESLLQAVKQTKDYWDCFSILSTFLLSCATFIVAARQYYISKQQKNIALYKERYEKLYKLILETIDDLQLNHVDKENFDITRLRNIMKNFTENMDYARFLIKEKDFMKIMELFNEATAKINEYHNKTYDEDNIQINKNFDVLNEFLRKQKKNIVDIIVPYLQIEK